jgi:3-keto-disaccharide hydrolase
MLRICSILLVLVSCICVPASSRSQDTSGPPEGFITLIGGNDLLNTWQGGSTVSPETITTEQQDEWNQEVPQHWRIVDQEIISDGKGPNLVTKREFENFELWVDWLIGPKGDSGIYLRGCPQVQIWDINNEDKFVYGAEKGSGGLWNNKTFARFPSAVADKPVGEWNHMFIRIVGQYVTVVLNGTTVVENVVMENYFDREAPIYFSGPIHLQSHGNETRFRNLFVREIPFEESVERLVGIRGGDKGFEKIFNGKNLDGWTGGTDAYEAFEESIRCKEGPAGDLTTEEEYDNFIIRFEVLIPPGGSNGLGIHVPSTGGVPAYDGLEIQVIDDTAPKHANLKDYQHHGSVFGLAPAHQGYLRPAGKWNFEEVVVNGDTIEVYLNGFKILNCNIEQARSKPIDGENHSGAYRTTGHIALCGHDGAVQYRNIRIRRIRD